LIIAVYFAKMMVNTAVQKRKRFWTAV